MPKTARLPLLALACLTLFGCASLPPGQQRDPRDPWERMNRTTFKVNDAVDRAVLKPIAQGYAKVVPHPVRTGVSNFMDNLAYPVTIVNDLLQLKIKPFGSDIARLVVNTTVGIGGIFDPASKVGLEKNEEDLGQTFGHWGAKPGPYVVIPLLGPSDVRDGLGRIGDIWADPRHYIKNDWISWGLWGVDVVDIRYRLLATDKLLDGVYDRYSFVKNAYLQRREYQIANGKIPDKQQDQQQYDEEKKILEESGGAPETPDAPKKPRENEAQPQATPDTPPKDDSI
jgi:phospholipid-binding lipoprotein MlaA